MSQPPSVSVILVNWNGIQDTLPCLDSLARVRYAPLSVIVVDNGSRSDEAAQIQSAFPDVTVLRAGRNLGFSGGNNLGIRHALRQGADYLLCLNNDTTVAPDFLARMVGAMEADRGAGVATCAIFHQDDPGRLNNLGCWLRLGEAEPFGYLRDVTEGRLLSEGTVDVPFAEGCVLMLRRAVAEAVGGFDEGLFAYHEDADLCLRAARGGWRCVAVPGAHVWHRISAGGGQAGSQTASYYSWRNTWHVVRRHGTPAERRSFRREVGRFVASNWRWYFRRCAGGERPDADVPYRDWLIYGTYGVWSGALGLRGPRARWGALERGVTGVLRAVTVLGSVIGPLARPFLPARSRAPVPGGASQTEARP